MTTFKRFTNPDVLGAISVKHLFWFFERFNHELQGRNLSLPGAHELAGTEGFYRAWLALLRVPDKLPESLVEALLAIEDLAAPENRSRLEAEVKEAQPTSPWLDPKDLPECQALQLWLINHPAGEAPQGRFSRNTKPVPRIRTTEEFGERPVDPPTPTPQPAIEEASPNAYVEAHAWVNSEPQSANPAVPTPNENIAAEQPATINVDNGMEAGTPVPSSQPSTVTPLTTFRRYTGKVARLPDVVRESLNLMIHDGVPYAAIREKLGEYGKGLKDYHLSRWRKHGYQEWLRGQERKELSRAKEQFALEMLRENDAGKVHEASLQIAAGQLCQFLADFDPSNLMEKLQSDPQNFVRLLHVLTKLSESGIRCESHRLEVAERQAKLQKDQVMPGDRSITPQTLNMVEELLRAH